MTLKSKFKVGNLEWEIEIFDNGGEFYGIASCEHISVVGLPQPTVRKALSDTQSFAKRVVIPNSWSGTFTFWNK
jgi:hypothetical protein